MAMSRLCTLGAALFAGASAGSYDWDKYMKQYAGGYYGGKTDGEFSDYIDRYAGNYSADANKYASNYSQDWIAQGQQYQREFEGKFAGGYEGRYAGGYEGKYAGGAAPAAAATVLAEAMPARNGSASQPERLSRSEELFASRNSSARQAQAAIRELQQWNAELEQHLKDQNFSLTVAKGIVTKVQTDFEEERERLQKDFNSALHNMSKAGSVEAAKEAMHKLQHLDHKEAHAMRKTLRDIQKAGKVKAKALWKTARKAAHQVYKLGMKGARAQIHEGLREKVYEQTMLDTEMFSEKLRDQAEEAAEKSELLVEQQFDRVEAHLEDIMHGLHEKAVAAHQAREDRLHAAEAASKAAEQPAPTVFLARNSSSQDLSGAFIAPLACVAMLAGMTTLLALRFCRSSSTIEHPLLG